LTFFGWDLERASGMDIETIRGKVLDHEAKIARLEKSLADLAAWRKEIDSPDPIVENQQPKDDHPAD
jgi:hypothetical protein